MTDTNTKPIVDPDADTERMPARRLSGAAGRPPQATVTQVGPLVYQVIAQHQWLEIGRWLVFTRFWARRKARRVLRSYQARQEWERQSTVVTIDELLDQPNGQS